MLDWFATTLVGDYNVACSCPRIATHQIGCPTSISITKLLETYLFPDNKAAYLVVIPDYNSINRGQGTAYQYHLTYSIEGDRIRLFAQVVPINGGESIAYERQLLVNLPGLGDYIVIDGKTEKVLGKFSAK